MDTILNLRMEIRLEEVIQTTDHPIELFYSALNNPATRRNYTNMLKKTMCEYLKPIIKVDATLVQHILYESGPKNGIKNLKALQSLRNHIK